MIDFKEKNLKLQVKYMIDMEMEKEAFHHLIITIIFILKMVMNMEEIYLDQHKVI